MNTKRLLKGVVLLFGVLILCSLFIPAINPAKTRTRVQRIGSVNAAPHVVMSMTLSNTAALQDGTVPIVGK
jgi:hypothetical protein